MITTEITSVREPHTETLLRTAAKHGVKFYRLGNWNYDTKLGVLGTFAYRSSKAQTESLTITMAMMEMDSATQTNLEQFSADRDREVLDLTELADRFELYEDASAAARSFL